MIRIKQIVVSNGKPRSKFIDVDIEMKSHSDIENYRQQMKKMFGNENSIYFKIIEY